MPITLPPPYNNAPIRPADVTQTMIDLYNVVAQINAGLSPVPINLSGPGGAALIGTTPAGGITSTTVQASLNELDTKKVPFTTLAAIGGAALVGNTPAGGIAATTVQGAVNELDAEKTSVATLAASGGAALVGNAPAGGISATTVQAAINELDSEKATIAAVQASTYIEAIGTGTADAIVGAFTPTVTSLTNGLELYVRSPGANTITNPTFQADGTAAKVIVKGNGVALQAGDSQGWVTLRYDSTLDRWTLLNPATPAGTALLISSSNGGQLAGFRNRVINGDMRIDQRNNGAAVTPGSGVTYTLDRFALGATQASKISIQQVVDAPAGFKYSLKATVASQFAPGAGDQFYVKHAIEGFNVIDLGFGTAAPSTITISIWVKGSIAGTYSIALLNAAANRTYIGNITVTSTWAKQTVTLTVDSTGTWATDSTIGVQLWIDLGSGTSSNAAANTWSAAGTRTAGSVTFVNQVNGSTLNITGFTVELGSLSTPFEQRTIGVEFILCQRYLPAYNGVSGSEDIALGVFTTTSTGLILYELVVEPRVAPTGITTTAVGGFSLTSATVNSAVTALSFSSAGKKIVRLSATGTGTPYAVSVPAILIGSTGTQILFTGSEL